MDVWHVFISSQNTNEKNGVSVIERERCVQRQCELLKFSIDTRKNPTHGENQPENRNTPETKLSLQKTSGKQQ